LENAKQLAETEEKKAEESK